MHSENNVCPKCGERTAASAIGFCGDCIRKYGSEVIAKSQESHYSTRRYYSLPESPPSTKKGIPCNICAHNCVLGLGEKEYCGLRWNENGRLVSLSTTESGLYYAYTDPHVTNCCAAWFCPAGTGLGYPRYAYCIGPEYGYENLAIFFYGCNFDCLFCQNYTHKEIHTAPSGTVQDLVKQTLVNKKISCWCFFGGSPEPQLPFAISASRRVLEALQKNRIPRICFEGNGCGNPLLVMRAAELSYQTGGCIKFDLKSWDENLSYALSGVSNKVAYENFRRIAESYPRRSDHPPVLTATTLLVPGYVDKTEVESIAKFIGQIDKGIPYSLLVFSPDFMMRDLPITPVKQVKDCLAAAQKYLSNVNVGNTGLLSKTWSPLPDPKFKEGPSNHRRKLPDYGRRAR